MATAPRPRAGLVQGVIVQFGGQTPLNLAKGLMKAGAPIIGTSVDSIDLAEDRDRFDAMLSRLGLQKPPSGIARTLEQAVEIANRIGYPVLVRPSYVLGGRGMEICSDESALRSFMSSAAIISDLDDAPVLIDRFLSDATEVDVDVIADFVPTHENPLLAESAGKRRSVVCAVMEHIEQAGIHSGDSSCTIPPWSLPKDIVERIKRIGHDLARALNVNGLMNVQLAIKEGNIYILEVNPRASRTVPFVGKAKHIAWPRLAAKVMMGQTLDTLGVQEIPDGNAYAVKVSVFHSTSSQGWTSCSAPRCARPAKSWASTRSIRSPLPRAKWARGSFFPPRAMCFSRSGNLTEPAGVAIARDLSSLGFKIMASAGTAETLSAAGIEATVLNKLDSGVRPNVLDAMADGNIHLVINTPTRTGWKTDEGKIRAGAVRLQIPMVTTITGAQAAVRAIRALQIADWGVAALQDFAAAAKRSATAAPKLAGAAR